MKILLDECVTKKLITYLVNYEVTTVSKKNWNGLRNGELMKKAEEDSFDIFLTIDKKMLHQQNFSEYNLIVVVLDSPSSEIEILKEYVQNFLNQISSFEKRKAYIITL